MQSKNKSKKNGQNEKERKPLPSANISARRKEIFDLSRSKKPNSQSASRY